MKDIKTKIEEIIKPIIPDSSVFPTKKWRKEYVQALTTLVEEAVEEKRDINIGMLRQWLNEDRIKDAKRFVTNEDIKLWLTSSPSRVNRKGKK